MASTPQTIAAAILTTETVLYSAFVGGGAARAWAVSLDFTNKTSADITIDVYLKRSGPVSYYLGDDILVPAKGTASWRGMETMDAGTDELDAIASAVGVDVTGTVVEDA